MKALKISLIALFIVSSFAACKKDDKEPLAAPLEGKWIGKFSAGNAPPIDFNFNIKPNGVLEGTFGTNYVFRGKWKLDGNNFTANYTENPVQFKATFDEKAGKLINGTWNNDPNTGTWYMDKTQ